MLSNKIIVTSRTDAEKYIEEQVYPIGAVISIAGSVSLHGEDWHKRPENLDKISNKLVLTFDDISHPAPGQLAGYLLPQADDVQQILDFGRNLSLPSGQHLLIHCAMGKSRSTAAALTLIADEFGLGKEQDAAAHLPKICLRKKIKPNILMIQYADYALKRSGALIQAIKVFEVNR